MCYNVSCVEQLVKRIQKKKESPKGKQNERRKKMHERRGKSENAVKTIAWIITCQAFFSPRFRIYPHFVAENWCFVSGAKYGDKITYEVHVDDLLVMWKWVDSKLCKRQQDNTQTDTISFSQTIRTANAEWKKKFHSSTCTAAGHFLPGYVNHNISHVKLMAGQWLVVWCY